jgi:hypothetical protein
LHLVSKLGHDDIFMKVGQILLPLPLSYWYQWSQKPNVDPYIDACNVAHKTVCPHAENVLEGVDVESNEPRINSLGLLYTKNLTIQVNMGYHNFKRSSVVCQSTYDAHDSSLCFTFFPMVHVLHHD